MPTEAQLAANRTNAQLSTGPKTAEGKAKIAHNAVRNALTGATILLPTDDAAVYQQHVANTNAAWQPETHSEKLLVQSIADTEWRLQRIPALIAGVLALGRLQHADRFSDQPENIRPALLEAFLEQTCSRDLRNLALQETRLRRHREKDIAELKQLQQQRRAHRAEQLDRAARAYQQSSSTGQPFDPTAFGFEFSFDEIKQHAERLKGRQPQLKAA